MIIRFGYEAIFHVANDLNLTYCGQPIDDTKRYRKRRRIGSSTVADAVPEAMWGLICGSCTRIAKRAGNHEYDECRTPMSQYSNYRYQKHSPTLVDILHARDVVRII